MSAEGKAAGEIAGVVAKAVEGAGVRDAEAALARDAVKDLEHGAVKGAADSAGTKLDAALLRELEANGVKHNAGDIVRIARDQEGNIVFLEKGNARAGLQHIVDEHADDFARKGIPEQDIPDLVTDAVTKGDVVGHQGSRPPLRTVYEVDYQGRRVQVAVSTGRNGFIVGANPR
jgi:hypothetical protein